MSSRIRVMSVTVSADRRQGIAESTLSARQHDPVMLRTRIYSLPKEEPFVHVHQTVGYTA
jgi:hypothetical protein